MDETIVDASAIIDMLRGQELGWAVADRLAGDDLHAPAHLDAEVLSGLGRQHRAGELDADRVAAMLEWLMDAPIQRHPVEGLLRGAWTRRENLRLADALYVELSSVRRAPLVTTDRRLRGQPRVVVVEA